MSSRVFNVYFVIKVNIDHKSNYWRLQEVSKVTEKWYKRFVFAVWWYLNRCICSKYKCISMVYKSSCIINLTFISKFWYQKIFQHIQQLFNSIFNNLLKTYKSIIKHNITISYKYNKDYLCKYLHNKTIAHSFHLIPY